MTVQLRAHHLLCMLTFVGEGYNPAFTANYRGIAERLSAGEDIEIVAGPDDICAPLMRGEAPHCLGASVAKRDAAAIQALALLLGRAMEPGAILVPNAELLQTLRQNFAAGTIRGACSGCAWETFCDRIARDGFDGTLIGLN
ncbi:MULTISPECIES: DUF1284 domain-containing protein [unclassified Sinorhizobium]|uniref:DUF1284 domain-containing protein n=1 Tax=unclassified Sinorhizobium TaxID=2613772 RepID=UPI003526C1BF